MKILVYGTLRQGQCRANVVDKLRQVGTSGLIGIEGLKMFDLGSFPGVVVTDNPKDVIVAELIDGDLPAIEEKALERELDYIEGVRQDKNGNDVGLYKKVMWPTLKGTALIYIFNGPIIRNHKAVTDWVQYCKEKEKKMAAGA